MRRQELAHILRSACGIARDKEVLVLGSQAILGSYDDAELPEVVTLSRVADIAFLDDPDRRKADDVEDERLGLSMHVRAKGKRDIGVAQPSDDQRDGHTLKVHKGGARVPARRGDVPAAH